MRAEHKRLTREDKFGRKFYCDHARLGLVRAEKKANGKKLRKIFKKDIDKQYQNMI